MSEQAEYGKRAWFFADGELPPPGDGVLKGHESLVVLNPNPIDADISICIYWEHDEPTTFNTSVGAERVRCLRTNSSEDMKGVAVPEGIQYAISLTSSVGIVVQYGRLDVRQDNMAFYASVGFSQ